MSRDTAILSITAHARSGALEHAWTLLREAGLEDVQDDPAVLSVRGRLLKDRAAAARGAERRRLYLAAAQAYSRAGELGGGAYPLINAATLSLLADDTAQAHALAREILKRPDSEDEPETPYYRAATRAEALLLLGEVDKAKAEFEAAIALAPRAWEDHASTLRQFTLILDALGQDKAWLDAHRPARSLHFAGHMALEGDGAELQARLSAFIAAERIGFGYGALAAGADILIAEALLEAGAELHLILPARPELFREVSVQAFGEDWTDRFARVLEAAASVRAVDSGPGLPSGAAIQLAEEVAMGSAVMQAEMLTTEAVQLLAMDPDASARGEGTARVAAAWRATGRRQHVEPAARAVDGRLPAPPTAPGITAAALLRLDLSRADADTLAARVMPQLARVLQAGPAPLAPPRWTGEVLLTAYDAPAQAAAAAVRCAAVLTGLQVRATAHYGLARQADSPFGPGPVLLGPSVALVREMAASTPPGAIHVSEDFAAALHAGPVEGRPHTEYVGELPQDDPESPVRLYSLKPV